MTRFPQATAKTPTVEVQFVQRHGPLVLSVYRRVLRNCHDAEDGFQATFLVLVRRGRSITQRRSLRSWLYGVAYRVARRIKDENTRRQRREGRSLPQAAPDLLDQVIRQDLRVILDGEILRLPARCRKPLILCYVEGRTNEEAGVNGA